MSWNKARARERIEGFQRDMPQVRVERFEADYLPRLEREHAMAKALGSKTRDIPPLYDLPDGAAVLVEDAVHVYVRAISYDEVRLENGVETEVSHARALSFLHLLYGSADRAVEAIGAQRVDYHGARMHAVIAEPAGAANLPVRIGRAVALAKDLMDLAREAAGMFDRQALFPLRFRVGMDVGTCIALNSGRRDDREPVFIGPAANHAAKLAAGDEEGVYMSDRVRTALGLPRVSSGPIGLPPVVAEHDFRAALRYFAGYDRAGTAARLDKWTKEARDNPAVMLTPADFAFTAHRLPLRTIDYAALSPSRSIRMPMVSVFADLDAYTRYVDECMATGCLPTAVRLLHILRSEFNAVFQRDFEGRKVRFIGDCIHGVIAAGSGGVDDAQSVELAARCAGGLRSSFQLCQELVEHADRLGLAIGFELGTTPVSRIGIRGVRAVRVASSLATRASERHQQDCGGTQTAIGPHAFAAAPANVRKLFGGAPIVNDARLVHDLTFDDVATAGGTTTTSAALLGGAGTSTLLAGAAAAAAAPSRAFLS